MVEEEALETKMTFLSNPLSSPVFTCLPVIRAAVLQFFIRIFPVGSIFSFFYGQFGSVSFKKVCYERVVAMLGLPVA